jgi:hypothetical protein
MEIIRTLFQVLGHGTKKIKGSVFKFFQYFGTQVSFQNRRQG